MIRMPSNPLNRMTASDFNRAAAANAQQLTLSGVGRTVPLVYGEVRIPGLYLARPVIYSGNLILAIGWAEGECEGVQALYINEADFPASGVTVVHYNGTLDQPVSPTLAAAIPGFSDSFAGVCYSVIAISASAAISGWPRVEAVLRGKRVYDPETGITAWSQNAGLCMRDFITSTLYGPGLPVTGWDKVAAHNDSLYDGLKRVEFNLALSDPQDLPTVLGIMSTYAECLWSYDGEGILLVPDSPPFNPEIVKPWGVMIAGVDPWGGLYSPPDIILTKDDIVEDSLTMQTGSVTNAPTSVVVNYLPSTGTAAPWVTAAARQALVGVDEGDVQNNESSLDMPGVRRTIEALRKASARLVRLQFQGRYSWKAFSAGIKFQKGDVVSLPNMQGLKNQWVRVLDVQMTEYGMYNVSAEHYDESMYADQINPVGQNGAIPVGMIIPYEGGLAPSGWSIYTEADGRFIVGAGGEYEVGEVGGDEIFGGISGRTTSDGGHIGSEWLAWYGLGSGGEPGVSGGAAYVPPHDHAFTIAPLSPDIYRRQVKLIQRGGEDTATIPARSFMFGKDGIYGDGIQRVAEHGSRWLMAGAVVQNAGVFAPTAPLTIGYTDDSHSHIGDTGTGAAGEFVFDYDPSGGGNHLHYIGGGIPIKIDIKTAPLAIYSAVTDFVVRPGFIGFWPGDIETIPETWYLCDGSNGTPEIVNRFIQIAGGETPAAFGDGTIKALRTGTNFKDHSHGPSSFEPGSSGFGEIFHEETVSHRHFVEGEAPYTPPYHALLPVMYMPEIE